MILFLCLAVGTSVAAISDTKECQGKGTYTFKQGCFDCWCRNGKATCSNTGNKKSSGTICKWSTDDEDEVAGTPGLSSNAAGVKPWDLDFPSNKEEGAVQRYHEPHTDNRQQQVVLMPPYAAYPVQMIYSQFPKWLRFWGRKFKNGHGSKSKGLSANQKSRSERRKKSNK